MIEDMAKIPVRVELASEFRYRKPLLDKNGLVIYYQPVREKRRIVWLPFVRRKKEASVLLES